MVLLVDGERLPESAPALESVLAALKRHEGVLVHPSIQPPAARPIQQQDIPAERYTSAATLAFVKEDVGLVQADSAIYCHQAEWAFTFSDAAPSIDGNPPSSQQHQQQSLLIGSQDATTCVIALLRVQLPGRSLCICCHMDGALNQDRNLRARIEALLPSPPPTLPPYRAELHLLGAFADHPGSRPAAMSRRNLAVGLGLFHQLPTVECRLRVCCVDVVNTVEESGTRRVRVWGMAMDSRSGHVGPVVFAQDALPSVSLPLRHWASSSSDGNPVEYYNPSHDEYAIAVAPEEAGSGSTMPDDLLDFLINANDAFILKHCSTSPQCEPSHFPDQLRAKWRFMRGHPDPSALFPNGRPIVYKRCWREGGRVEWVQRGEER